MTGAPIAGFVQGYAASGVSRLHMPGHKGRGPLGCEALDITEIAGADSLYEAAGVIAESEAAAAALFGTEATLYSAGGSSQCIRAMLLLALQAAPSRPGRPLLLAARNAHRALLDAAALLDFDIEWLWPGQGGESLCACPVAPAEAGAALDRLAAEGRQPFGLYLTSPDYLGGLQDIAGAAAACHARGVPLLVDNAHGAYLRFLPGGSRHPIGQGADLCADSAHKTLPVLTGGAYLHIGRGALAGRAGVGAARHALALFGSTSPSYLILQSLDLCNQALAGEWPARLADCIGALDTLKGELEALVPGIVRPSEPLKLVLDGAAPGCGGRALADTLRAHQVECEYADSRHVVLMFAPGNPPRDYARVRAAVQAAALSAPAARNGTPAPAPAGLLEALRREAAPACTIRQAVLAPQELVPLGRAAGRICAAPAVSCPPGIPVAVSGERLGLAALRLLREGGVTEVAVVADA